MNRRLLVLLTACVLLVLAGCGSKQQPEGSDSLAAPDPMREDFVIETKYGDLHFPDQWEDLAAIDQEESGDVLIVRFRTVIRDTAYDLFALTIGGDGEAVRHLQGPDQVSRGVTVQVQELAPGEDLDEGETKRLYAMQEDLNFVLDHLDP